MLVKASVRRLSHHGQDPYIEVAVLAQVLVVAQK
jgi:hypothetical protein